MIIFHFNEVRGRMIKRRWGWRKPALQIFYQQEELEQNQTDLPQEVRQAREELAKKIEESAVDLDFQTMGTQKQG